MDKAKCQGKKEQNDPSIEQLNQAFSFPDTMGQRIPVFSFIYHKKKRTTMPNVLSKSIVSLKTNHYNRTQLYYEGWRLIAGTGSDFC